MISKPTIFVSHAATDQPIAQVVHDEIKRIFANGVTVYTSSVPGVVKPGRKWLEDINVHLTTAAAVIVVVTPVSINRPWIWFEVGASWSRMEEGTGLIIPLCYGVDKGALPEPLGRLQAMSLANATETKEVFRLLIEKFGFGSLSGFRYRAIMSKLPQYEDLRVDDLDLRSGTIYTGPYEGYTDTELSEVLDDTFVRGEYTLYTDVMSRLAGTTPYTLFSGKLIHFRECDESLRLPPGTAKRLLV